jgi:hypothetical protein
VPSGGRQRLAAVSQQTVSELTSVTTRTLTEDVRAALLIPGPDRLAGVFTLRNRQSTWGRA